MMEDLGMKFVMPNSRTMSLRLNREEEEVLTDAARFHGVKLSTYIKAHALTAARRAQTKMMR